MTTNTQSGIKKSITWLYKAGTTESVQINDVNNMLDVRRQFEANLTDKSSPVEVNTANTEPKEYAVNSMWDSGQSQIDEGNRQNNSVQWRRAPPSLGQSEGTSQ